MSTLDEFRHMPEEKGKKQRTDMCAVNICIRHDDDSVVPEFVRVEFISSYSAPQRRNQRSHLDRRQHLVEPGLLDIQDLAFKRQYRLVFPVPTLLSRAPG